MMEENSGIECYASTSTISEFNFQVSGRPWYSVNYRRPPRHLGIDAASAQLSVSSDKQSWFMRLWGESGETRRCLRGDTPNLDASFKTSVRQHAANVCILCSRYFVHQMVFIFLYFVINLRQNSIAIVAYYCHIQINSIERSTV